MLVSMDAYGSGVCGVITPNINSKADAIAFAVQMSISWDSRTCRKRLDMKKAQKIYDFFVNNVNLPDIKKPYHEELFDTISPLLGLLSTAKEKKAPPGDE